MNIAVCMKWVRDPDSPARFDRGTGSDGPEPTEVVSPVDMTAAEVALQLAEQAGGQAAAYSFGDASAEGALRPALAIGVKKAVRVDPGALDESDALAAAQALASAIGADGARVVVCGGRSPDMGTAFVPAVIARELGAALVQDVIAIETAGQDSVVVRQKVAGGGQRVVAAPLPAVIGVLPGAAEPRYPSTRAQIMAAKASIDVRPVPAGIHGSGLTLAGISRPRPAAVFGPDPALPAKERYRVALSAGVEQRSSSRRLEGAVDDVASQLLELLAPFRRGPGAPVP